MPRRTDPARVRQNCPRCRASMQVRFRRNDCTHEWGWVWTCPDCKREIPVPDTVIEQLDYI